EDVVVRLPLLRLALVGVIEELALDVARREDGIGQRELAEEQGVEGASTAQTCVAVDAEGLLLAGPLGLEEARQKIDREPDDLAGVGALEDGEQVGEVERLHVVRARARQETQGVDVEVLDGSVEAQRV